MHFSVLKKDARNYDVQQFLGNPNHLHDVLGLNPNDFTTLENGIEKYLSRVYLSKKNF
jgi:hypothetical protein